MKQVNWGIIGCGDVTEVKSGPAFNKVERSALVAVMRRDAAKAKDYALRHNVPRWYSDAGKLIRDPDVNAVYVATPPQFHEAYTIEALKLGKPVYVEKPMALTEASCLKMIEAANKYGAKLTIAHYRRALPIFNKVKEWLTAGAIGKIQFIRLDILQPAKNTITADLKNNWRIDPSVSGGGLFHDLAPHHIDLMIWLFGQTKIVNGYSANQSGVSIADDIVSGELVFENDVIFQGLWCFNVAESESKDACVIMGSDGKIEFSFHKDACKLVKDSATEIYNIKSPVHVQQPMIEKVVKYFTGEGPNPCSAEDGAKVLHIMDIFTGAK